MLLLRNIAQVVTLRSGPIPRMGASMSDLGIIENGAVLIHADRIVWVGHTKDIPVRDAGTRYQTLDGIGLDLIALPGFVDCHTHPVFDGGRAEDYDLRIQGKELRRNSGCRRRNCCQHRPAALRDGQSASGKNRGPVPAVSFSWNNHYRGQERLWFGMGGGDKEPSDAGRTPQPQPPGSGADIFGSACGFPGVAPTPGQSISVKLLM